MLGWLSERAKISPDKPAVVYEQQVWSYQQLNTLAESYAAALLSNGICPGERVGILMQNCVSYVGLIHAVLKVQAVLVPLNTRLTANELSRQIEDTQCKLVIVADTHNTTIPTTSQIITLSELEATKPPVQIAVSLFDLTKDSAVLFTSGTSGRPKGAVLSNYNLFYSAMASAYRLGTFPHDQWLCTLPLYHVGGLSIVVRACLYGISINLQSTFSLEMIDSTLSDAPITLVSLVPTMLYRLIQNGNAGQWSPTLRMILLGGAAASPELMALCAEKNLPVATTYGLTEATSQVATLLPPRSLKKAGSAGKPLLFTDVQIVNEKGKSLSPGNYGEILVKGPTVMRGYHNNPVANEVVFLDDYLRTGDIGYLDDEGDLWVAQRRSDLIITGGENVYPREVEQILNQHPAVHTASVVGIDDPEWGQIVAAMVVPKDDSHVPTTDLQDYCRKYLAGYKIPRQIRFVQMLPETASGKINRSQISRILENGK